MFMPIIWAHPLRSGLHDGRLYGDRRRFQGREALLNYRCDSTLSEPAPVTPEWSHIRGRAGYLNPGDNTRPYPIQAIRPTCPTVIR
jgi:hypothetical protein